MFHLESRKIDQIKCSKCVKWLRNVGHCFQFFRFNKCSCVIKRKLRCDFKYHWAHNSWKRSWNELDHELVIGTVSGRAQICIICGLSFISYSFCQSIRFMFFRITSSCFFRCCCFFFLFLCRLFVVWPLRNTSDLSIEICNRKWLQKNLLDL